jgi:hypothetical protein
MNDQDKQKIHDLFESGRSLIGSSVSGSLSGVLGFLAGGPIAAAGAGAIGNVLGDVINKNLSKREQVRVGATAYFALSKIKIKLAEGKTLRTDGFFEQTQGQRAKAEEIFEGVLLKVKNEHEEKKSKFIANIFANSAFLKNISLGEANFILKLIERFTYKQLCALALYNEKFAELRKQDYNNASKISFDTYGLLLQLIDLYNLGLLACRNEAGDENVVLLGPGAIIPDRIFLSEIAKKYCIVMGLEEMPREEIINEVVIFLV